jgi:hypothetical protein
MNEVYVIVYKDTTFNHKDTIEGVLENESQFSEWLIQHNDDRRELDEDNEYFVEETEEDFQLVRVPYFKS